MTNADDDPRDRLLDVLETVADMTIATVREDGFPQASTVSFVNDGLTLYFATSKRSQKAVNLERDARVSITVNKPYRFWKDIVGLSAGGHAVTVSEPAEYRKVTQLLFKRFPEVHDYSTAESETLGLYRIDLTVATLLDYRKGVGHTVSVDLEAPSA